MAQHLFQCILVFVVILLFINLLHGYVRLLDTLTKAAAFSSKPSQKVNCGVLNLEFGDLNEMHKVFLNQQPLSGCSVCDVQSEILYDSTRKTNMSKFVQKDKQRNDTNSAFISNMRKNLSKYPYNPLENRTFRGEDLKNEKFTGNIFFC